jgi:hypothetical protein
VSALTVSNEWGLSREAAWTWLHKFRRAMVRPARDPLSGMVEIDETFVGGVEHGVVGQLTYTKAIVVIAVERPGCRALHPHPSRGRASPAVSCFQAFIS